jgi:transcriptional regulator with XRE-family HTH domain
MVKIQGDTLEKMICLSGLNREDFAKRVGTTRQTLLGYIKANEADEFILKNIENEFGLTPSKVEYFLQNVRNIEGESNVIAARESTEEEDLRLKQLLDTYLELQNDHKVLLRKYQALKTENEKLKRDKTGTD